MIKLKTNCDDCTHKKVCKNINNAEHNMNKLKKTQYDSCPNDDYDWDTMMQHYNVVIEFSCPDFENAKPLIRTSEIKSEPYPCINCKHYMDKDSLRCDYCGEGVASNFEPIK